MNTDSYPFNTEGSLRSVSNTLSRTVTRFDVQIFFSESWSEFFENVEVEEHPYKLVLVDEVNQRVFPVGAFKYYEVSNR